MLNILNKKKKNVKKSLTTKRGLLKELELYKKKTYILIGFLLILIIFIVIHFLTSYHGPKEVKVINHVLDDNYVFLGDSITSGYDLNKYYENYPVVNSGVSGYKTQDILDRMENMVYRYNPSKVFILIGTNDIQDKKDKEYIINNIEKIISNIKENRKYTEIYIESIYPINSNKIKNRSNEFINELNVEIKRLCKEHKIKYIDIHTLLLDENGELDKKYSDDGLHIKKEGYEIITEEIKKYMN